MATHAKNLAFWKKQNKWKPNSVVVVTGAGSGIGREVALQYAKRRCRLVLADIQEASLVPVAAACKRSGSKAIAVPTDVTKEEQTQALMARAVDEFGGIDVLVLCAGIGAHHVFADTKDLSVFHKLMSVNFTGYLNCTHAAYPHLIASKGVLVAITSFSGEVGLPYRTAYCASKFAVTGFLEALRAEMAALQQGSFDITIVCPPTVNTNLRKSSLTTSAELRNKKSESALTVEQAGAAIIDAADRRLRKAFFPWKSWMVSYIRPLVPDLVDGMIRKRASL